MIRYLSSDESITVHTTIRKSAKRWLSRRRGGEKKEFARPALSQHEF